MRKDMDKVLVTTPRIGSKFKNEDIKQQRRYSRDNDDYNLPNKSSMKPKGKHSWHKKELNEYLKPLVRYLRKNCGRPWDKVYSEICENMDRRGVVQDHIFQHLFEYVELNPIFREGSPHSTGYGGLRRLYKSGWSFYVDNSGLLKEPKKKRPPWRQKKDNPNLIKTNNKGVFLLKRGSDKTWFKVTLKSWSDSDLDSGMFYEGPEWVTEVINCAGKKIVLSTLSKKEKKALGIK